MICLAQGAESQTRPFVFGSLGHQGLGAYQAVVLGQEDCDARVHLANSQRDQHGEWKSGEGRRIGCGGRR